MKYVAFLDILGFKDRIRGLKAEEAKDLIRAFSGTIFNIFNGKNSDGKNSDEKNSDEKNSNKKIQIKKIQIVKSMVTSSVIL